MTSNSGEDTFNSSESGFHPGTTIQHYKIVRKLGQGGMGEVYLAEDVRLERFVALKFLPSSRDKETRRILLNEAKAASKLNHPNIISIYSFEEHEGDDFVVMEFVEGDCLGDLIHGELQIEKIVDISMQVCLGLAEAHKNGIVHGDLKPSNIMIDKSGVVKICDFGLAHIPGGSERPEGSPDGTLSYMSPEQAQCRQTDHRSDLFSLGVIMYEMITGTRPFGGEYEAAIVYSIVNETPKPLSSFRADASSRLQDIVAKLLEKDVDARYQSSADVISDLRNLVDTNPDAPEGKRRGSKLAGMIPLILALAAAIWVIVTVVKDKDRADQNVMVAVLPFENLGPEENEYWAEGITDAIIGDLARIPGMGVISRTSVQQYKGTTKTIRQIGKELGVDHIVEGTVLLNKDSAPPTIRINVQLIEVASDTHIWPGTYERTLENIFAIQADIADSVADKINLKLVAGPDSTAAPVPTVNTAAYDLYLKGLSYFNRSWRKQDVIIAIQKFEEALALDSSFALAYTMLSRAHSEMYWEHYDHSEVRLAKAKKALDTALDLDPGLPEAHLAMGMYYYSTMQYDNAEAQFKITEQSQPDNSDLASSIAGLLRRQGKFDGALTYYSRAYRFDPRSHLRAFDVALTLSMLRRYPEAESLLNQATALAPDWALPYIYQAWIRIFWQGDKSGAAKLLSDAAEITNLQGTEYVEYYWWLSRIIDSNYVETLSKISLGQDTTLYFLAKGRVFHLLGNGDSERAYFDSARIRLERYAPAEDPLTHSRLGLAYAGLGRPNDAAREGRIAVEMVPYERDSYIHQFMAANLAEIYVMNKEYDLAVDILGELLSKPGFVSVSYLKSDPIWKPLAANVRFKSLIVAANKSKSLLEIIHFNLIARDFILEALSG
jgi:TolB-like protein/Tfp pilus assembly protein PilF/predicted Ser/Thr protein kinase